MHARGVRMRTRARGHTRSVPVQTSAEVYYKQLQTEKRIQQEDYESQKMLIRVLVPRTLIRTVQRLVLSSICLLVTMPDRGPFALGAVQQWGASATSSSMRLRLASLRHVDPHLS